MDEISSIVLEYLHFKGFTQTAQQFENESMRLMSARPGSAQEIRPQPNPKQLQQVKTEMKDYLENGMDDNFFYLWEKNILPYERISNEETLKMEFYLRLYFASIPVRQNNKVLHKKSMIKFKEYLDQKGVVLSHISEVLPYFALPYISNPLTHPTFTTIFNSEWTQSLFTKFANYISKKLSQEVKEPRIYSLIKNGSVSHGAKQTSQNNGEYTELFGLCSDLVYCLNGVAQGKQLNKEFLQMATEKLSELAPSSHTLHEFTTEHPMFASLDYNLIKNSLLQGTSYAAHILQALRWRITKTSSHKIRQQVVLHYVESDMLDIKNPKSKLLEALCFTSDKQVTEYFFRFLNAFVMDNLATRYIASYNCDGLIRYSISILKSETSDSLLKHYVLAFIQKISISTVIQQRLVAIDSIELIVGLIREADQSDFFYEYATALLMNLSVCREAKVRFETSKLDILGLLMELLVLNVENIKTFVNGCLYCLLRISSKLQEKAREIGLETYLVRLSDNEEDNNSFVAQQIQYVIKAMKRAANENEIYLSSAEESNQLVYQEVDHDYKEELIEEEETLTKEQLVGEDLLCSMFASNMKQDQIVKVEKRSVSMSLDMSHSDALSTNSSMDKPSVRFSFDNLKKI